MRRVIGAPSGSEGAQDGGGIGMANVEWRMTKEAAQECLFIRYSTFDIRCVMNGHGQLLRRSMANRQIAGVCGGLGEYFGIDPTVVRVVYVLFSLVSIGTGFLVYLLLWLVIPEREYY